MEWREINGKKGVIYFPKERNTGLFIYHNVGESKRGNRTVTYNSVRIHDVISTKKGVPRTYFRKREITNYDAQSGRVTNHVDIPSSDPSYIDELIGMLTEMKAAIFGSAPVEKKDRFKEEYKKEGLDIKDLL